MEMNLQLFGGGGKGKTVVHSNYTPTEAEKAMQELQLQYMQAIAPNMYRLNDAGANLLWDSIGDTQVDYRSLLNQALNRSNGYMDKLDSIANQNSELAGEARQGMQFALNGLDEQTQLNRAKYEGLENDASNATNQANSELESYRQNYSDVANRGAQDYQNYINQYGQNTNATNGLLGKISDQYGTNADQLSQGYQGISNQYGTNNNATNEGLQRYICFLNIGSRE